MPRSCAVVTLGCEKNTVDSEVIAGMLSRRGIRMEKNAAHADMVILNTCGFIDHAKHESIGAILEALELKKSGAVQEVYVAGCLSERYRSELEAELPEVDRFFGTQDFERILSTVTSTEYRVPSHRSRWNECGSNDSVLGTHHSLLTERQVSTPKHYAYLKISEGCDHPCSFCAIPIMRGGHRSRAIEELEFEAMMLAANGTKELVLIAQDSTNYGLDLYGNRSIASLLTRLARIPNIEWIRLMYAYPAKFPMDLLDVMASEEKVVPYLDIPVQHASTEVLKSMRRGITRRATEDLLGTIRERVPGIALRTTLIAGYPAEGEREFQELEEFVETMRFDRLGVFTYSQEDGTTAHPLGDPVPQQEKLRRQARLYDIQAEITIEKNRAKIGSVERVIIERKEQDGSDRAVYFGRTAAHAPEVDGEVMVRLPSRDASNNTLEIGSFVNARMLRAEGLELEAEWVA